MKKGRILLCVLGLLSAIQLVGQLDYKTTLNFEYDYTKYQKRKGQVSFSFWKQANKVKLPIKYQGASVVHEIEMDQTNRKIFLALEDLNLKGKFANENFKLVVSHSCKTTQGGIDHDRVFHELMKSERMVQIPFEVKENGYGEINVRFDIIQINSSSGDHQKCLIGEIQLKLNIKNTYVKKLDKDNDGIIDGEDNCLSVGNPTQTDLDNDTVGDVCDNCPFVSNNNQLDSDNDGKGNACDNCPYVMNPDQEDINRNGIGDACEFSSQKKVKKHRISVENKIRIPTKKGTPKIESNSLLKLWERLKKEKIKLDIYEFYALYGNYKQEVIPFILEYFPSLDAFQEEVTPNRKFIIKINDNFFAPRFKNTSLKNGMVIDDSNWMHTNELTIHLTEQGSYKLLIRDSIGRQIVFPIGYQFQVACTERENDIVLTIKGGNSPFKVSLKNKLGENIKSQKYEEREIILSKEDLIEQGIIGNFLISVSHSKDARDEITLSKDLKLVEESLMKAFIIIGWMALIGIIGGIVFFLIKKK